MSLSSASVKFGDTRGGKLSSVSPVLDAIGSGKSTKYLVDHGKFPFPLNHCHPERSEGSAVARSGCPTQAAFAWVGEARVPGAPFNRALCD
jgi:hypothetical protein